MRMNGELKGYIRQCLLVLVLLPCATQVLAAEWDLHQEVIDGTERSVATVSNEDGDSMRIYRDEGNQMQAVLSLERGMRIVKPGSCVTFQVDDYRPISMLLSGTPCSTRTNSFAFSFGKAEGDEVTSGPLSQMLYGMHVTFRYPMASTGYSESVFTLRGSKSAIGSLYNPEAFGDAAGAEKTPDSP